MDFGAEDALYVSDMVIMSKAGRARVHALFEAALDGIEEGEMNRRVAALERGVPVT